MDHLKSERIQFRLLDKIVQATPKVNFGKTSFMNPMKLLGALDIPKGIISNSYNPYLVLKAISHSSLFFILIY